MSKPKIFVSFPILKQAVPDAEVALQASKDTCQDAEIEISICMGDSIIHRVRSSELHKFFYHSDCDYYAQLSDDMQVLDCTAENNVWTKLMARDKDMVGGIYRVAQAGPCLNTSTPADIPSFRMDGNLHKMLVLSGGLWLVKRSVIARMYEKYKGLWYSDPKTGEQICHLFKEEFLALPNGQRRLLSEDFGFCLKWRAMGGEIWGDTSIRLAHWGMYPFVIAQEKNTEAQRP